MKNHNKALPYSSYKTNALLDLFCLHYAGGSVAVFREWDKIFPDWIAIQPIELPGRGSRIDEPLVTDPEVLITDLTETIGSTIQRPWALFGHSLGAAFGYRICLNLQKKNPPLGFFPAGRHAPTLHDPAPKRAQLSDADLIETVRELGGSPEEVLENKELMSLLLPMIRADFLLSESIQKMDAPLQLDCLTYVFGGSDDPEVPVESLIKWQAISSQKISIEVIEGNHFFLHERSAVLVMCQQISERLKKLLPRNTTQQQEPKEEGVI